MYTQLLVEVKIMHKTEKVPRLVTSAKTKQTNSELLLSNHRAELKLDTLHEYLTPGLLISKAGQRNCLLRQKLTNGSC